MGRTERLYGLTVELWLVSVLAKFSCRILLLAGFDFFTLSCLSGWFIQLRILAVGSCDNFCSSVFNIYSLLQANKSSFFTILLGLPAKGNYMMVGLTMWLVCNFNFIFSLFCHIPYNIPYDQYKNSVLIAWTSSRLKRVTRSTIAAKTPAMTDGCDTAYFILNLV